MVPSCSPWVRYFVCELLSVNKQKHIWAWEAQYSCTLILSIPWVDQLIQAGLCWTNSNGRQVGPHVCEILITSKSLMMWQWTELLWSLRCRQNRVVCTVDGWVGHWRVHNYGATQFLVSVPALTCPLFSVMRKCTRSRMYLLNLWHHTSKLNTYTKYA